MSDLAIILLISLMSAAAVGGVGYAVLGTRLTGGDRASKRMQRVASSQPRSRSRRSKAGETPQPRDRRKLVQETLKEVEDRQKAARARAMPLRVRLARAGLALSPKAFYLLSAISGLIALAVALVVMPNALIAIAFAFVAALGLPRWFLSFRTKRYQKAFVEEFANSLDVIVRGVKAGLPLNDCLQIVAREAPDPVGPEFRRIVEAQRMGVTMDECLQRFYERIPVPEVNFFVTVLTIQQNTGGNLSEALGNLSNVLRSRKEMRGKIQAMSGEAKASAAIIGSLPPAVTVLIYLSSPDYIMTLFTEPVGHLILLGGVLSMALGIFVMRQMINFDI